MKRKNYSIQKKRMRELRGKTRIMEEQKTPVEQMPDTFKKTSESDQNDDGKKINKEERRSSRSGSIFSLVALLISTCGVLFCLGNNVISIYPNRLLSVWTGLWVLMLIVIASVVIIIVEIIKYIYKDFKRLNVIDNGCSKYDKEADLAYDSILSAFENYILFLSLFISALIVIFIYNLLLKIIAIVISLGVIILLRKKFNSRAGKKDEKVRQLPGFILRIKEKYNKLHNQTKSFIKSIAKLVFVALLLLLCFVGIVIYNMGKVDVDVEFDNHGKLTFDISCIESLDSFCVNVYLVNENSPESSTDKFEVNEEVNGEINGEISPSYDEENDAENYVDENAKDYSEIITGDNVENNKESKWCLKPMEESETFLTENYVLISGDINDDIENEFLGLSSVNSHCKYISDLNDINLQDGKYRLEIRINKGIRELVITNEFIISEGIFKFGFNRIKRAF